MKNDGKQLEKFVKAIEAALLPAGFDVKLNERVFDGDGNQIAEFDIIVTGKIGSASFKWLIECRDRSSQGPAPVSWIEQLVGRRERFNFDKVTAVSTTGFAVGARSFAKEKGIELRRMTNVTLDNLLDCFQISHIEHINQRGNLINNCEIQYNIGTPITTLQKIQQKTNLSTIDSPFLISKKDGKIVSLLEAWQGVLNISSDIFNDIYPNQPPVVKQIIANYPDPLDRYQVKCDAERIDVVRIVFEAELSISSISIPIFEIVQYEPFEEENIIAQSLIFKIDETSQQLIIHGIRSDNGLKIAVQSVPLVH